MRGYHKAADTLQARKFEFPIGMYTNHFNGWFSSAYNNDLNSYGFKNHTGNIESRNINGVETAEAAIHYQFKIPTTPFGYYLPVNSTLVQADKIQSQYLAEMELMALRGRLDMTVEMGAIVPDLLSLLNLPDHSSRAHQKLQREQQVGTSYQSIHQQGQKHMDFLSKLFQEQQTTITCQKQESNSLFSL